jgi:hypothetical protein
LFLVVEDLVNDNPITVHQAVADPFLFGSTLLAFAAEILLHFLDFPLKDFSSKRQLISLIDLRIAASNPNSNSQSTLTKRASELGVKVPAPLTLSPRCPGSTGGHVEATAKVPNMHVHLQIHHQQKMSGLST